MSIQNYATAQSLQELVSGNVPCGKAEVAERLTNTLTVKLGSETVCRFNGESAKEVVIPTAQKVVEIAESLPSATEGSADVVCIANGETYLKQPTGDGYEYAQIVLRENAKVGIGQNVGATGSNTVAIGVKAIGSGVNTVAIGRLSAATLTEAVAIGSNAQAKHLYTIAIGKGSQATANGGIAVGKLASSSAFNGIAVGNNAAVSTENTIVLGDDNINTLQCHAELSVTSDERDKAEIEPLDGKAALALLAAVRPVRFVNNQRSRYVEEDGEPYDRLAHARGEKKGTRKRVGLIAQQVQQAMLDLFHTDNFADIVNDSLHDGESAGDEGKLTLRYSAFIPFLIAAVQQLSARLDRLEKE